ncbi:MAG TPA: ribonuclease R [Candidatus Scybalocola faecigallinarum]|uniref:Ribonuclease R n=1 Tax=Candidatus Scybalocola faecigallinarum TaxID=2840941 RepID=A0A9D1JRV7_9FIRM|nr:ribonuclease R [Candidatus Scybalocola faecigallinarum]
MDEMTYQIREQMLGELFSDKGYRPMKLKELGIFLNVPRDEREDLKLMLDQMISKGMIAMTSDGRYTKPDPDIYTGTFMGSARGFGFVRIEGMDGDVFISEGDTLGALHGDTVAVRITRKASGGRRQEGQVLRIVSRANDQIVGTYDKSKKFGFVIPDNSKISKDIFVRSENSMGAVTGHKVVVQILDYGNPNKNPEGRITEILGHVDDPQSDVLTILRAYNIPVDFPEDVAKQIKTIPDHVTVQDMEGRKDLRDLPTVTIDGEDAKDLDDAITISKEDGIYHLGVHIADVSHYVRENSPLDREALNRGTSVYLVDRVVPMLPRALSNGICSLNQGCDRLALSCLMDIDQKGQVIGHEIAETVIRVDRRMTYTAVNKIITHHDKAVMEEYEDLVPMFELMKEAADVLREKRRQRGGIDFDFPEAKIILDDNGFPVDIHPYERNSATKIIEDFMLVANETIAEDFFWQELPFLYRTHETPDLDRIRNLMAIISGFGYYMKLGRGEVHPKEVQKLLGKIQDTPEEAMISRLTLRSMKRARYTTENTGHFGLAVKYYCHFTSPIRRYPDLQIHRIIKENLHGALNVKRQEHYYSILPEVADSTSMTERRADDAQRDVEKLKKVEYMSQRIGQIYTGVISGLGNLGMYVELPNTCEGLIRLQDMEDDYYFYDEEKYMISGETLGITYRLGQKIRIRVLGADKLTRTIYFVPEDEQES